NGRRPGKPGPGPSATTDHGGTAYLYVFSTSTVFEAERGYSKFSAYALLEHGGDVHAAAKELYAEGYGERVEKGGDRTSEPATADARSGYEAATVNWPKFWATEHVEEDYACAPLIVRGRSHAAVSLAKVGKSLLFLENADKKAT